MCFAITPYVSFGSGCLDCDMEDKKKIPSETKAPDNLIIYDPDKPLYQKLHLCIYLRELLDETEYVSETLNQEEIRAIGGIL